MKAWTQCRFRLWHLFLLVTVAAAGLAWASYRHRDQALLSRPYILVDVEPAGSAVYRDGQYLGKAPLVIKMPDAFFDCYEERQPAAYVGPLMMLTKERTEIVLYDGGRGSTLSFIHPSELGENSHKGRGIRSPIARGGFIGANFSGTSPNRLHIKLGIAEPTKTNRSR